MSLTEKNRVIIYVWTSAQNELLPGKDRVGHIGMKFLANYASLWPEEGYTEEQKQKYRNSNKGEQLFLDYYTDRKPGFTGSLEEDCKREGEQQHEEKESNPVQPQAVITLYSLDPYLMEVAFKSAIEEAKGFRLIGSNLIFTKIDTIYRASKTKYFKEPPEKPKSSENCASFALKILKAGGLRLKTSDVSKTSSVVSPDDILRILVKAKAEELEKYEETQGFRYPGETSQTQIAELLEKIEGPFSFLKKHCQIF